MTAAVWMWTRAALVFWSVLVPVHSLCRPQTPLLRTNAGTGFCAAANTGCCSEFDDEQAQANVIATGVCVF